MTVMRSPSRYGDGATGKNCEVEVSYGVRENGALARCGGIERRIGGG